jgi:hypothetical protein
MGLTNTKVWYIMPKPCIQRFDNMIHMWYKGDTRFGDMGFGRQKDYDAIYKSAPYSTILHFTPLLDCLII